MNAQTNVRITKEFFSAIGKGDKQVLIALCAEDIEWIIPGEWAWAGTHRGHAGLTDFIQRSSETVEILSSQPPQFIAEGDRVLAVGLAKGKVKATNRTFEDHFIFDFTVRDGKVTNIREYIDTLALARASGTA
jgi:ketosteroid isomerase-like protein